MYVYIHHRYVCLCDPIPTHSLQVMITDDYQASYVLLPVQFLYSLSCAFFLGGGGGGGAL